MKAVLLSIQPKWCELIAKGKKTVEVRKTKPKLETPFKVYIYQTRRTWTYDIYSRIADWQGKVIGEFVCDKIDYWTYYWQPDVMHIIDMSKLSCVSVDDLLKYSRNGKDTLYGWHISDLVIYDKPKELSEFCKPTLPTFLRYEDDVIKRPPQSWCYVEELSQ